MKKILATILALVMALGLCTSAWATGEAGTGEGTGATTASTETGGTGANGTEGGKTGGESGSEGTSGETGTTYVAQIGETKYMTLQAAVDAAKNKVVKLIANTNENVTISQYNVTIDLNGFTLNGGTEEGKPALTVTNRVTVQDSSTAQTGTIKREDTAENSGVSSHYVIDVQGKNGFLLFKSGTVTNGSGAGGTNGASLVRIGTDDQPTWKPQLTIEGGTFSQDNFIVLKVGGYGVLYVKGGTINSKNSYAVENWSFAVIKDQAVVNGKVSSWTYQNSLKKNELEIRGGTVNGDVEAISYDGVAGKRALVSISGGTVNGTLITGIYGSATEPSKDIATIEITSGTFKNDPTKYVVEDSAVTKNEDNTFGVAKAYLAEVGETSYYTMDEAFHAAVASGETLYLLRDYTTGAEQNSGSKSFAIDLDGHTWTYTGTNTNCAAFQINYSDVTLTVKNGTVVSNSMVGLIPSAMGGTITYNNAGLVFENVTMTAKGHSGIETNGNNTNDAVTLKNSTLNVPNGFGIYFPSSGTLTINNSTINAKTMGVQVCAGSLEITGESAITVTGDAVPKTENDGAIQDGAAISVVDRTGYKGLGKVEVKNGSFTAKTDEALKAYKYENKEEGKFDNDDKKLTVTGGTFSSQVPSEYVAADKRVRVDNANSYTIVTNGSITSGTYTEEPTVAPGYKAVQNTDGTWRVEKTSGGYYYYPSTPGITAELNGSNKSATDYPGGEYGLVFRSTAAFSTFQGVQVDGKTLAKSNYTAEEGSTVVYLKAAYLKTLAAGKHTITILSTAGNTSMDFTIGGKSSSPKTFDAGVGIYAVTAVLSVTGMAWTAKKRH